VLSKKTTALAPFLDQSEVSGEGRRERERAVDHEFLASPAAASIGLLYVPGSVHTGDDRRRA
jgi:hypothetical protein